MPLYKSVKGKAVYVKGRMRNIVFQDSCDDGMATFETEDKAEIEALKNALNVKEIKKEVKEEDKTLSKKQCMSDLEDLGFKNGIDFQPNASKAYLNELVSKALGGEIEPNEEPEDEEDEEDEKGDDEPSPVPPVAPDAVAK